MSKISLETFLNIAPQFQLGHLPTESSHPLTQDLSSLIQNDLPQAIEILKQIDLDALKTLASHSEEVRELTYHASEVLNRKGRVFLVGCGATGRLACSVEYFWSLQAPPSQKKQVIGLIAGGDVALVHSIESFEDHAELGKAHLEDFNFNRNDLFVGITEGGETPYVLGATQAAAEISRKSPFFLYCNPDETLLSIKRSRSILEDQRITKMNLSVGPMALSGSTRLQAATVQMLATGMALLATLDGRRLDLESHRFAEFLADLKLDFLIPFIEREAELYRSGQGVIYQTENLGLTVLTDTTERSPTFHLPGFENALSKNPTPSPCHLCIPSTSTPQEAWQKMLGRSPRPLEGAKWSEWERQAGLERLMGFDFSSTILKKRQSDVPFQIQLSDRKLVFSFEDLHHEIPVRGFRPLLIHSLLKIILNIHSLGVMGLIQRYDGNLMTWVKPSNNKLIDRAIRTLTQLSPVPLSYEDAAERIFKNLHSPNSPVIDALESLRKENTE